MLKDPHYKSSSSSSSQSLSSDWYPRLQIEFLKESRKAPQMSSPIHPHRYVTSQNKDSKLQSSVKAQFKQVYAYLTLLATMHHQHVPKESKKETNPHTIPNLVPTAATAHHDGRLKDPQHSKIQPPKFLQPLASPRSPTSATQHLTKPNARHHQDCSTRQGRRHKERQGTSRLLEWAVITKLTCKERLTCGKLNDLQTLITLQTPHVLTARSTLCHRRCPNLLPSQSLSMSLSVVLPLFCFCFSSLCSYLRQG